MWKHFVRRMGKTWVGQFSDSDGAMVQYKWTMFINNRYYLYCKHTGTCASGLKMFERFWTLCVNNDSKSSNIQVCHGGSWSIYRATIRAGSGGEHLLFFFYFLLLFSRLFKIHLIKNMFKIFITLKTVCFIV